MKAIRIHKHGGPEVLKLEDVEIEPPGHGQALIQIKRIGVNFVDIYYRRGDYASTDLPFTPGVEGAGIVEAVGPGVSNVRSGDRVAFSLQNAAYAEKCLVQADQLILIPSDLSFDQAAAFSLQGMTAHYLLHDFYQPKRGDTVLIHAAAGGMGLLLIQWAKHLGARVFGTVSSEEKAHAAQLAGASEVIIYTKKDFVVEVNHLTNKRGVSLIIDGVGKSTFAGNLQAAAIRGHIVIYGAASGPAEPISPNALMPRSLSLHGGHLRNFTSNPEEFKHRSHEVLEGIRQGWLKLSIHKVLPLAQAEEAHRLLENRKTTGKILLAT